IGAEPQRHSHCLINPSAFERRLEPMTTEIRQAMAPTRVTADEIIERMNRGEKFTFLDARNPKAWSESDEMLLGALRVACDGVKKHLDQIPRDRTIITYCT